jgi:predicted metal-dependent phosphoesterase TrpH
MQGNGHCDLHTHTQASDGLNTPSDNVAYAKEKGLSGLAITDHDTVAGVAEALEAGKQLNMIVIAGIEISTTFEGKDIHVLGYGIDIDDLILQERLALQQEGRDGRNQVIVDKLSALGMPLKLEDIRSDILKSDSPKANGKNSIGRPHIAQAMVRKGYVENVRQAFDLYLGEGKPAYAAIERISPNDAVKWIVEAGGAPVLAHPGLYRDDDLVLRILQDGGFKGVEVFHSDHTEAQETTYLALAAKLNLTATGGSDFHGKRQGQLYHGDLGSRSVPMTQVEKLLSR